MRILLTNDDGVKARGIRVLFDALNKRHNVTIVAPLRESNASSHSLSLKKVLKTKKIGPNIIGVDGTPTDCVILGIYNLLSESPELLISGINSGPNLGEDVSYSGTVGAAMEGAANGIPSVALSLYDENEPDFEAGVKFTLNLIEIVKSKGWMGRGITLNVNIPPFPKGIRVTKLGKREYEDVVDEKRNGCIIGGVRKDILKPGTDISACKDGYISVTPLHTDLTCYEAIEPLKRLF